MADMLKFKRGLFANLPTTAVAGTVYITTDERGMYVDVANGDVTTKEGENSRIRIAGDIIQYESIGDPKINPPFSTDVLYYFIAENALMKWTGSEWKQLNKVSDIQTSISDLQDEVDKLAGSVSSNTAAIGANATAIETNATAIAANAAAIESNDADIEGLTSRVGAVETLASTNESGLKSLNTTVDTLAGTVSTHGGNITDLTSRVGTLEDTVGNEGDTNTILGRLKVDETAITANTAAIGTDTTEGTVKYRVKQLETTVNTNSGTLSTHEEAIAALQEAIGSSGDGDSLASRMDAVEAKNEAQDTAISAAQSKADQGVTDAAAAQATANEAKSTADTNAGKLATLEGDSSVSGSVANQVAAEATARAEADTNLQSQINSVKSTAEQGVADAANAQAAAEAAQSTADKNAGDIATLNGDDKTEGSVAYAVAQAKAALSAEIDADINAANAMNYISNIDEYSELPSVSDGVHVGDTYVVGTGFTQDEVVYNAGDMLIAEGTEGTDGYITGVITWNHVKTGYDASNEPSLVGVSDEIKLLSHLGASLGTITFANAGTNADGTVQAGTVVTVTGNEVEIGIQWGTF